MHNSRNPFHEMYVTELAKPDEFVRLFSPILMNSEEPKLLFQSGNVILRGTQGSGKSMLLTLLKPEIRVAYYNAKIPFPVPLELCNFLSAGINFTRSGIVDFGQRSIFTEEAKNNQIYPLLFADFFNYWLLKDIIQGLRFASANKAAFSNSVSLENCDGFAAALASEDCFFGYFTKLDKFDDLYSKISGRIQAYRKFNQFNIDSLPQDVLETKTSIGEPLSRMASLLRKFGIVTENFNIHLRIDQLEVLCRSEALANVSGTFYRQVINKALSTRDPAISYKIGTRRYAWLDETRIFGMRTNLEPDRNYKIVDIDDLLRRKENVKTYIFPDFAKDVFHRRLNISGFNLNKNECYFSKILGSSQSDSDLAKRYVGANEMNRALTIDSTWPNKWKDFVELKFKSYTAGPLTAKFIEATLRQGSAQQIIDRLAMDPNSEEVDKKWERDWWIAERSQQALIQISSRCAEKMHWSGIDDVLNLTSGSILTFVSICHHIWRAFLMSRDFDHTEPGLIPDSFYPIDKDAQSAGIHDASQYWYNNISVEPRGHERKSFCGAIGHYFRRKLIEDKSMSYPGHIGFSLIREDLKEDDVVATLLNDAVDYGNIVEVLHTSRNDQDLGPRIKYYLNPILAPCFAIPAIHKKEPEYVTPQWVRERMAEAKIIEQSDASFYNNKKRSRNNVEKGQLTIFEEEKKE